MHEPRARTPWATDELVDTMARLWPQAEVSVTRSHRRDPASLAEWALVPSPRATRQLVPLASSRAAARSLRRFSAAASLRATTARLLAMGATRSTGGAALAQRVRVHGSPRGSLDEHLAQHFGRPVCWSLGVGPARVNRKPLLQVFDERGTPLAFAKLGDEDSRRDVEAEADALAHVGAESWRTMLVPRLLGRSEWNGMLVVLMSPLRTRAIQRPSGQFDPPVPAMQELADRYAEPATPVGELAWTRRQHDLLAGVADTRERERTAACLEKLVARAGDQAVNVAAMHGDWTPWNVARSADGRWAVWDWERFERGTPAGLDRHHWHVNAATRAYGASPVAIRAGLDAAERREADETGGRERLPATAPETTGSLYLLATAVRYLVHRDRPLGDVIDVRTRVIIEVLEQRLRAGTLG